MLLNALIASPRDAELAFTLESFARQFFSTGKGHHNLAESMPRLTILSQRTSLDTFVNLETRQ